MERRAPPMPEEDFEERRAPPTPEEALEVVRTEKCKIHHLDFEYITTNCKKLLCSSCKIKKENNPCYSIEDIKLMYFNCI